MNFWPTSNLWPTTVEPPVKNEDKSPAEKLNETERRDEMSNLALLVETTTISASDPDQGQKESIVEPVNSSKTVTAPGHEKTVETAPIVSAPVANDSTLAYLPSYFSRFSSATPTTRKDEQIEEIRFESLLLMEKQIPEDQRASFYKSLRESIQKIQPPEGFNVNGEHMASDQLYGSIYDVPTVGTALLNLVDHVVQQKPPMEINKLRQTIREFKNDHNITAEDAAGLLLTALRDPFLRSTLMPCENCHPTFTKEQTFGVTLATVLSELLLDVRGLVLPFSQSLNAPILTVLLFYRLLNANLVVGETIEQSIARTMKTSGPQSENKNLCRYLFYSLMQEAQRYKLSSARDRSNIVTRADKMTEKFCTLLATLPDMTVAQLREVKEVRKLRQADRCGFSLVAFSHLLIWRRMTKVLLDIVLPELDEVQQTNTKYLYNVVYRRLVSAEQLAVLQNISKPDHNKFKAEEKRRRRKVRDSKVAPFTGLD